MNLDLVKFSFSGNLSWHCLLENTLVSEKKTTEQNEPKYFVNWREMSGSHKGFSLKYLLNSRGLDR